MNRRVRTGAIRWTALSTFYPEASVHVADWVRGYVHGRPTFVIAATTAEAMPRVRS